MAESSTLAIAMNIFTAPSAAFAALKERPRVWLPLLLLLGGYVAVNVVYINSVDLGWLTEAQLASSSTLTEAQREQAATAAGNIAPAVYAGFSAAATTLVILLVVFLVALYYTILSFVSHDGVKLRQWFAFVWWCTLPAVFGLAATLVNLSIQDARFMLQDAINPLAFGNLLAIERTAATPIVSRILLGLDLFTIWSLALSTIGYQQWTGKSFVKSVAVVLGPLALIVVIATLIALR